MSYRRYRPYFHNTIHGVVDAYDVHAWPIQIINGVQDSLYIQDDTWPSYNKHTRCISYRDFYRYHVLGNGTPTGPHNNSGNQYVSGYAGDEIEIFFPLIFSWR
jgi:hypothetical protein